MMSSCTVCEMGSQIHIALHSTHLVVPRRQIKFPSRARSLHVISGHNRMTLWHGSAPPNTNHLLGESPIDSPKRTLFAGITFFSVGYHQHINLDITNKLWWFSMYQRYCGIIAWYVSRWCEEQAQSWFVLPWWRIYASRTFGTIVLVNDSSLILNKTIF